MQITIIGCGNIGTGIARRLSSQQGKICLYDRDPIWTHVLSKEINGHPCCEVKEAIAHADLIILAVKPQNLEDVAHSIQSVLSSDQILVSLLAGTSIETLKEYFDRPLLVRMMPNLPLMCGEGVIGLAEHHELSEEQKKKLDSIFQVLGQVYWLPEKMFDALTSLTGSGPAFLFTMIEAMIDAGIAMGFRSVESKELVLQMIKGTISLLQETNKHPGELKWQVTSPGGTTIEGLKVLEEEGVRGKIMNAFIAAYDKAKKLN
jgi:pyrroline-5-carboxylate reductase